MQLKIIEIYLGQYQTFILCIWAGNYNKFRGNFWQGPFAKDALLENGTKSHNFTNLFFCDVTLQYSIDQHVWHVNGK